MGEKTIYDLKLHESIYVCEKPSILVVRVPGGWIYNIQYPIEEGHDTSVFIPYDDEFTKHY